MSFEAFVKELTIDPAEEKKNKKQQTGFDAFTQTLDLPETDGSGQFQSEAGIKDWVFSNPDKANSLLLAGTSRKKFSEIIGKNRFSKEDRTRIYESVRTYKNSLNTQTMQEGLQIPADAGMFGNIERTITDPMGFNAGRTFKTAFATQELEDAFQQSYSKYAEMTGNDPNPDDPMHYYDYRGAFSKYGDLSELAAKDEGKHLPSEFKMVGHPNLVVDGVNTQTGQSESDVQKRMQSENIALDLKELQDIYDKYENKPATEWERNDISKVGAIAVGHPEWFGQGAGEQFRAVSKILDYKDTFERWSKDDPKTFAAYIWAGDATNFFGLRSYLNQKGVYWDDAVAAGDIKYAEVAKNIVLDNMPWDINKIQLKYGPDVACMVAELYFTRGIAAFLHPAKYLKYAPKALRPLLKAKAFQKFYRGSVSGASVLGLREMLQLPRPNETLLDRTKSVGGSMMLGGATGTFGSFVRTPGVRHIGVGGIGAGIALMQGATKEQAVEMGVSLMAYELIGDIVRGIKRVPAKSLDIYSKHYDKKLLKKHPEFANFDKEVRYKFLHAAWDWQKRVKRGKMSEPEWFRKHGFFMDHFLTDYSNIKAQAKSKGQRPQPKVYDPKLLPEKATIAKPAHIKPQEGSPSSLANRTGEGKPQQLSTSVEETTTGKLKRQIEEALRPIRLTRLGPSFNRASKASKAVDEAAKGMETLRKLGVSSKDVTRLLNDDITIDEVIAKLIEPEAPTAEEIRAKSGVKTKGKVTSRSQVNKKLRNKWAEILPNKKVILEEIDKAIAKAPDTKTDEMLHFEIDGGINVYNNKKTLKDLRKKIARLPEKQKVPVKPENKDRLESPPSHSSSKPSEGIEGLNYTETDTYFTDGKIIIKGKPPKTAGYLSDDRKNARFTSKRPVPEASLLELLNQKGESAEILYYATRDESGEGVSMRPIVNLGERGSHPVVIVKTSDGKFKQYNQYKFLEITKRFPNADFKVTDNGTLIAYDNGEPVAALMADRLIDTDAEPVGWSLYEKSKDQFRSSEPEKVVRSKSKGRKRSFEDNSDDGDYYARTLFDKSLPGSESQGGTATEEPGKETIKDRMDKEPPENSEDYVGPDSDDIKPLEQPELIKLARQLMKKVPKIKPSLKDDARGVFLADGDGHIYINADIYIGPRLSRETVDNEQIEAYIAENVQRIMDIYGVDESKVYARTRKVGRGKSLVEIFLKDPDYASRTIAHEIGHLIDYLGIEGTTLDKTMKRGNILGRIASLKNFRAHALPGKPFGARPLTKSEKDALRREAKKLMTQGYEIEIDEYIERTTGVSPADILALINSTVDQRTVNPELYAYFAKLDRKQKKAILVAAMKGLVHDDLKQFATVVRELTGKKIKKWVEPEASKESIREKYIELLKKEIKKRMLLYRDTVENELKELTVWWKGPVTDESKDYRFKSEELYADAISVLLNRPDQLAKRAPEFWRGFHRWLIANPRMEKSYYELQTIIAGGEEVADRVARIYQMFNRGERAREKSREERSTTFDRFFKWIRIALDDRYAAAKDERRARGLRKKGKDTPRESIEALTHCGSSAEYYLDKATEGYKAAVRKGVDPKDIGMYAFAKRVIFERDVLANPIGENAKTAPKLLEFLKKKYGDELYAEIEKAYGSFQAARKKLIIQDPEFSTHMQTPELIEHMLDNDHYATFNVVDYLNKRYGSEATAKIYKQIGTHADIENPIVATLWKDLSFIRAIHRNRAVRDTIDYWLENGDRKDIQRTSVKSRHVLPGMEELFVFRNGQLERYLVDKQIARGFESDYDSGVHAVGLVFRIGSFAVKGLLTAWNPGFGITNVQRDLFRAIINLPDAGKLVGKNKRHLIGFQKMYWSSWKEAWRSTHGKPSELVEEMLQQNVLISVSQFQGFTKEETEFVRLMSMFTGLTKEDLKRRIDQAGGLEKFWKSTGQHAKAPFYEFLRLMETVERVSKIACYKYLKENFPDLPQEEINHIVRSKVGSPDFMRQGFLTPITNALFLYSNPFIQATKSNVETIRERPGQVMWNYIKYGWVPTLLRWLWRAGLATAVIKIWFGEDSEAYKFAKEKERQFNDVSEYMHKHYQIIPLYRNKEGRTVYIPIGQDEQMQVFNSILWDTLENLKEPKRIPGESLKDIKDSVPDFAPQFRVIGAWGDYLSGNNPTDYYRGNKIIDDITYKAGGREAVMQLLKWSSNEVGLGLFYRFGREHREELTPMEVVMGLPVLQNIIRRVIRTTDAGRSGISFEVRQETDRINARRLNNLREIAEKQFDGVELTYPEQLVLKDPANARYVKQWKERLQVSADNRPWARQIMRTLSNDELDRLTLRIREIEGPEFDLFPLVQERAMGLARTISKVPPDKLMEPDKYEQYQKDLEESFQWFADRGVAPRDVKQMFLESEVNPNAKRRFIDAYFQWSLWKKRQRQERY